MIAAFWLLPSANADGDLCAVSGIAIASDRGAIVSRNPSPESIENRTVDIEIYNSPLYVNSEDDQNMSLHFRLCTIPNDETIPHVTYEITIRQQFGGQPIFHDIFHSHTGLLTLVIQRPSNNTVQTPIIEATRDPALQNSWIASGPDGTINMISPIMHEIGTYYVSVNILGLNEDKIFVNKNNAPEFDMTLNVASELYGKILYNSQNYNVTIRSSYGKLQDFHFEPTHLKMSWSTFVNGNAPQIYNNNPFQEIIIPKSFTEFVKERFLNATVNGITWPSPVVAQPGTGLAEKNDIEVYIIGKPGPLRDLIQNDQGSNTTLKFSLLSLDYHTTSKYDTKPGGVKALVSWTPDPPNANSNTTVNVRFFNSTGTPLNGNVVYDIWGETDQGINLLEKDMLTATNGKGTTQLVFPQTGIYRVYLHVRGLFDPLAPNSIDNRLDGEGDGYVVVIPEFPTAFIVLSVSISLLILFSSRSKFKF